MRPRRVNSIHAILIVITIVLIAIAALFIGRPGYSQASPSDVLPMPQLVHIDGPSCAKGTVWGIEGLAPRSGTYTAWVMDEQGTYHVVATQHALLGEHVNAKPTSRLHPGEVIGVVLTITPDTNSELIELDRELLVGPTGAFCSNTVSK